MADKKATSKTADAGPTNRIGQAGAMRFQNRERAKDSKGTFRKLLRFYLKEGPALFVVLLLSLLNSALVISGPYLIGQIINGLTETGIRLSGTAGTADLSTLHFLSDTQLYARITRFIIILMSVYLVDGAAVIVQGVLMNRTSQKIVFYLRQMLFDKFQKLPLTYHDSHTHGELMSRLTNDIDNISQTIAQSTVQLVQAVLTVFGSVVMMLNLNVYLTLAVLVTVPLVILLTKGIAGKSIRYFRQQQKSLGELNGLIEESISGQKMVKSFNMEDKIQDSFSDANERLRKSSFRAQVWSGVLMPFMNVITNLGYVCVAATGGILAISRGVPIGAIASFVTYSRQFTFPLNNIAGMFNNLQSALAGAERVFEILEETDEPEDKKDAVEMKIPKGEVRFDHVSFSYVPEKKALNNVSFIVKPGQKIALVGPTGAGKTTVVNLLTRFYDVTEGAVYIDGIDIRNYKRDSLIRAFSVVLQDTCLFTGSISDNIRYGRPEASDGEVIAAAKAANAHAFIMRLKNGYDTKVSAEIDSLSQGQRQLLAISRAVLCRAPILILDEATSSVDTHTEFSIQEAVLALSAGRTSFVIAHRLSTIRDADMIFVIQDGKIVEKGTHQELIVKNDVYAEMHNSQYSMFSDKMKIKK